MFVLKLLGAVLILSFLVIIHELGHYLAAKKNGVEVKEFGVGFPPTFAKFKKWGTVFKLNWIPLGGYVKLYGEDATDPKVLKSKKSFASKTPWQKIEIVLAGVLMNFLVFWVFMSVAFVNGVSPLVTSYEEFQKVVSEGYYTVSKGVVVAQSNTPLVKQGDRLLNLTEGVEVADLRVLELQAFKENQIRTIELSPEQAQALELEFFGQVPVTTFEITNITENSLFQGELLVGDKIFEVNNFLLLDEQDFLNKLIFSSDLAMKLFRGKDILDVKIDLDQFYVVDKVLPDSPAARAEFLPQDQLIAVDGLIVEQGFNIAKFVREKGVEKVVYTVRRDGADVDLLVEPLPDGTVGVFLTKQFNLADFGLNFVVSSEAFSAIPVKDFRVGWAQAPLVALDQGVLIAKLTAQGFGKTVWGIITSFKVSEEVGGPVQVMKMSYDFIGKGGTDLLSFIALLSLSLAVINLLPIPALDGGRFLFILIEAIRGKKLNPRFEASIHLLGFILLIMLILIVSMYDISRL